MRRPWQRISVTQKGALVLIVPTLVALSSLVAWSWSRQQEREAANWVIHTEEVMGNSNHLLTLLVDAETGIRGYGLTQDARLLRPYTEAQQSVPSTLSTLTQLTQDNPTQQNNLAAIKTDIASYFNLLKETRLSMSQLGIAQSSVSLSSIQPLLIQGKDTLDELRDQIDSIRAEEQSLLLVRRQNLMDTKHTIDRLLAASFLLSLVSYGGAFYVYTQADKKIQVKAQALSAANQSLSQLNITLAQRNQELDDFTHTVSHDLKAPLRAINNLSSWIFEDLEVAADSESGKHIALLQEQVNTMSNLIDGLLAYAKADRTQTIVETVDVSSLIQDIVKNLDIPPQFQVAVELPLPTIETEKLLLSQIFSNLISNSYKHHSSTTGTVTIAAKANSQDRRYTFYVSDDGPGILPEDRDRIFKIFQTLSSKTSDSTGIGLSIVKKIVESRGGIIDFTSETGQGTTFYFTW